MNELMMMEAALFQLRAALADDPAEMSLRLGAEVLASALAAARAAGVNAARVNDIVFALNDLTAAAEEAGAEPAVLSTIAMLQNDARALRVATALAPELLQAMRELQMKLKARARAVERSQYRAEGTEPEPLPHPPEQLREAAIPVARQLAAAGFETPALDALLADPDELRYHGMNEILDELDVIAGT
jgi:hypothetical protein